MAHEIMAMPPIAYSTRELALMAMQAVALSMQVQIQPTSPNEAVDRMAATEAIPRRMAALLCS